ncbi:MAG: hypothetical protein M1825_001773 [Sarcosagium campestre]|nr:MAG: hypothetical protein M1825_001773 [Sarcosagium campestre]
MAVFSTISFFVALQLLFTLQFPISSLAADANATANSTYWLANIPRRGYPAYNPDPTNLKIFRNVKDYGATGDGSTDDTDAINRAISDGKRCGQGCDSSTTTGALVYFPPGTYMVKRPIVQLYMTQFVGDALHLPTIKARGDFEGAAVIDSNPTYGDGKSWYTHQNNFYRQIRNFVIDLTDLPEDKGTGIHWQVARATSLQNIVFNMRRGGAKNRQQGLFMDNGSGGFMTDLVFNGGRYGAYLGSQQFTSRNLTFNECDTAIWMNWNWLWTLKNININKCKVGIDMTAGGFQQSVGSVTLQDSKIADTPVGVYTAFDADSKPITGGTLVLDNVDFTNCAAAVSKTDGRVILKGNTRVSSWIQGRAYSTNGNYTSTNASVIDGTRLQAQQAPPQKPGRLLDASGAFFAKSRPQYETVPVERFASVKEAGAKGNGVDDDTSKIQDFLNRCAAEDKIAYFDHGAYIVSDTINVPKNVRITGEMWPLIMAKGSAFQDQSNPRPVFRVGEAKADQTGNVEMSDLIFSAVGTQPGAIMVEWNLVGSGNGRSGLWDVHMRVGGAAGTLQQAGTCDKTPEQRKDPDPKCVSVFMMLHITRYARNVVIENSWLWTADHDLDNSDHGQLNIFTGRGLLLQSPGPVWLYGTSSEHHQLYNYQLAQASSIYMGGIQTETPQYQPNPNSLKPYAQLGAYTDPDWNTCAENDDSCRASWGLRAVDSKGVLVYGAGLYSFYQNWNQTCSEQNNCQLNIVDTWGSVASIYGLSTVAVTNMIRSDKGIVSSDPNKNAFASTIAIFRQTGEIQ